MENLNLREGNRRFEKINIHSAQTQVEQENIKCETCEAPVLEDGKYCLFCKSYWEDVRNGLFDYSDGSLE
jgi:hypothetical protein